jgi:hypothetical protein
MPRHTSRFAEPVPSIIEGKNDFGGDDLTLSEHDISWKLDLNCPS